MSSEIKNFLSKLENWKENLEVKDFEETGDDELSQIVAMQRNKDVDGLLKVWESKIDQDNFELPHPENQGVTTRAVYSVQYVMANFVFMIDSENRFPWFFGQCEGFIDVIITTKYKYKSSLSNAKPINANIKKLFGLQLNHLRFDNKQYGFLLGQARPYHFFYDHLKFFIRLETARFNTKKIFFPDGAFYSFGHLESDAINDGVFLFPAVVGNNQYKAGKAKNSMRKWKSWFMKMQ